MQLLTLNHTQHAVITEEELSKILMNKGIDTRSMSLFIKIFDSKSIPGLITCKTQVIVASTRGLCVEVLDRVSMSECTVQYQL